MILVTLVPTEAGVEDSRSKSCGTKREGFVLLLLFFFIFLMEHSATAVSICTTAPHSSNGDQLTLSKLWANQTSNTPRWGDHCQYHTYNLNCSWIMLLLLLYIYYIYLMYLIFQAYSRHDVTLQTHTCWWHEQVRRPGYGTRTACFCIQNIRNLLLQESNPAAEFCCL